MKLSLSVFSFCTFVLVPCELWAAPSRTPISTSRVTGTPSPDKTYNCCNKAKVPQSSGDCSKCESKDECYQCCRYLLSSDFEALEKKLCMMACDVIKGER